MSERTAQRLDDLFNWCAYCIVVAVSWYREWRMERRRKSRRYLRGSW